MASSLSRLGAKPPSSPTVVLWPAFLRTRLERVEDLGDHADALGEALRADRHDHEFLEVDLVVGVLAAVDDVGHRHRQDAGVGPADVAVEGQARGPLAAALAAARLTPRIALAPSLPLFGVPSASIIARSRPTWSAGVAADDDLGQRVVDVGDGLGDALAEVPLLVAVAQLDGLVNAGAGAGGDGGAAEGAVGQDDVDLDGRVASAVEDLASVHLGDGCGRLTHVDPQIP